jgi:1-acyl-sn-glycerol-3-phosphate acyltransferase
MQQWQLKPAGDLQLDPASRWRDYHRESGLVSNVARLCWWSTVKSLLKVVHRLEVHGREHVPGVPSYVLVANHASHLDALVLGSTLPLRVRDQLFPLAAGDVFFEAPAVAAFSATVLNALPVWRKNCGAHAIKDLRQRLISEPSIYILFPEGGRSRDGKMLPFKPGIGMMVAQTNVPVIPCHLTGTFEAFPANTRVPRPHKIRLHIGAPRVFADVPNKRDGWEHIAHLLEQDVTSLAG